MTAIGRTRHQKFLFRKIYKYIKDRTYSEGLTKASKLALRKHASSFKWRDYPSTVAVADLYRISEMGFLKYLGGYTVPLVYGHHTSF